MHIFLRKSGTTGPRMFEYTSMLKICCGARLSGVMHELYAVAKDTLWFSHFTKHTVVQIIKHNPQNLHMLSIVYIRSI